MKKKNLRRTILLGACVLSALLTGCATHDQSLYYWGNYQAQQYEYFKGEKGPEGSIQEMEKIREEAKAKGKSVPPGFQAHLGMLYGQTGRTDLFEQNIEAERQYFPESAVYLDFLQKKGKYKK